MTGRNWDRLRDRNRMRAKGVEAAAGDDQTWRMPPLPGRRRRPARQPLTKAEARTELERLVAEYKAREQTKEPSP